ncbi:hypothetical protein [Pseudoalteromonas sp. CnMc7-37]|uniref:hypothetical protein n=1 Tax=Pseudoalteromonas sp. CnMc7-37 TaxID=2954496 RepID=UPI002097B7BA|nr:hypothetical protein [Pseudoalteromonas sp. CnMc7-37]MCO7206581.1 hypothetical protein [Pseudoalteromonas sp. CnMc7-37]
MTSIKDQDLSKNQRLVRNIVLHAVDQVNFTLKNLGKRPTFAMLIECENCLTDLMPVIKLIADDYIEYAPVYDQMTNALEAVQIHEDVCLIEFA